VNVLGDRAITERRDLVVERIHARIEITRRHERLEDDLPGRGLMRLGEDGLSFGTGCLDMAFSVEAVEGNLGRVVALKGSVWAKVSDGH
jgi:hypothetical protein